MSNIPSLEELLKAGVHFGHQKSKWHPKMGQYIFTDKNGVHIINLEETQRKLIEALEFLKQTVAKGGTVLFVGTKKQAQTLVKEAAEACSMPYIVYRWMGGTLTNAVSVLGVVKKYRKLKQEQALGDLQKYTKKERLNIAREIERLTVLVGGIESMEKVPDALFILDLKNEKTALSEAIKQKIPVVALCDTNVNPEKIDYPIPSNDDATSSIKLMVNIVSQTIKQAKEDSSNEAVEVKNQDAKKVVVEKKQEINKK